MKAKRKKGAAGNQEPQRIQLPAIAMMTGPLAEILPPLKPPFSFLASTPALKLRCVQCGAMCDAACDCGAEYLPAGEVAAKMVEEHPELSNRVIAEKTGVHNTTVMRARRASAANAAVGDKVTKTVGKDGKKRAATRPTPAKPASKPTAPPKPAPKAPEPEPPTRPPPVPVHVARANEAVGSLEMAVASIRGASAKLAGLDAKAFTIKQVDDALGALAQSRANIEMAIAALERVKADREAMSKAAAR